MNLEQLRGFAMVADTGHFTEAAARLHLAQPSLSRQIATLERDLGVSLFHRARGNVTLTAAGEQLLPTARRMLADAALAREEMQELAGLRRGRVRLGATPTLCTSLVAEVVATFRSRFDGIDIEIMERGSRTLIPALLEGALDLALIVTGAGSARSVLELEPVLKEQLVVVERAAAPRAAEDPGTPAPISLAELATLPLICFPENYDLRAALDAAFEEASLDPAIAVEGVEMDAALSFAERGVGVAVVPAMVAADRPGLVTHPLEGHGGTALERTVSLARRADMAPTSASAAMRVLIREVSSRLTGAGAELSQLVTLL